MNVLSCPKAFRTGLDRDDEAASRVDRTKDVTERVNAIADAKPELKMKERR